MVQRGRLGSWVHARMHVRQERPCMFNNTAIGNKVLNDAWVTEGTYMLSPLAVLDIRLDLKACKTRMGHVQ